MYAFPIYHLPIYNAVVTTVCMSLSIPISALADELVMQQHRFSSGWLIGAQLPHLKVGSTLDLP